MALYMRYIATDLREVSFVVLEQALRSTDPTYCIETAAPRAKLMQGEATLGRVEVYHPGEEDFRDEVLDLRTVLEELPETETKTIRQVLHQATAIVVVQVVWEDRDDESTLARIQPLWQWLLANRTGVLQIDRQGYFGPSGLLLKVGEE